MKSIVVVAYPFHLVNGNCMQDKSSKVLTHWRAFWK